MTEQIIIIFNFFYSYLKIPLSFLFNCA